MIEVWFHDVEAYKTRDVETFLAVPWIFKSDIKRSEKDIWGDWSWVTEYCPQHSGGISIWIDGEFWSCSQSKILPGQKIEWNTLPGHLDEY